MKDNLIKDMALEFNKLTGRPAYFYDTNNWLYKAENGEVTKLSKTEPEKVEATITIDDAEQYIKEFS